MNQTVTAEAAEHMATGRALGGSRYATMVNFSDGDVTCGEAWAARVRSVNEMGKGPPHWYSSVVSWCIFSRSRLTILTAVHLHQGVLSKFSRGSHHEDQITNTEVLARNVSLLLGNLDSQECLCPLATCIHRHECES